MAAALASQAAVASMVSTIPVVVLGGVVYKMTEAMLPGTRQNVQTVSRKRVKKSSYDRNYSGNFSNVGF